MSFELSYLQETLPFTKPGSTLLIKDGVYDDIVVTIDVSGTFKERIIIKAENEEGVKIRGNSKITIKGDFITIQGFSIDSSMNTSESIDISGNNVRITNVTFKGTTEQGNTALIINNANSRVDHCTFSNLNFGIRLGENPTFAIVDHNVFNNMGICFLSDLQKTPNALFSYNKITNCPGDCIYDTSSGNIYYKNNISLTKGTAISVKNSSCTIIHKNRLCDNNIGVFISGSSNFVTNNFISNKYSNASIYYKNKSIAFALGTDCLNVTASGNIMLNCSEDFAVGIGMNMQSNSSAVITNNISFGHNDQHFFSATSNIFGIDDVSYSSNICYLKMIGNDSTTFVNKCEPGIQTYTDLVKFEEGTGQDDDTYKQNWFLGLDENDIMKTNEEHFQIVYDHLIREFKNQ